MEPGTKQLRELEAKLAVSAKFFKADGWRWT